MTTLTDVPVQCQRCGHPVADDMASDATDEEVGLREGDYIESPLALAPSLGLWPCSPWGSNGSSQA